MLPKQFRIARTQQIESDKLSHWKRKIEFLQLLSFTYLQNTLKIPAVKCSRRLYVQSFREPRFLVCAFINKRARLLVTRFFL